MQLSFDSILDNFELDFNLKIMRENFRFENLDVWKKGIEINDELFDLSDELDKKNYRRFAEQLRSASLSVVNNIAEGSGSNSNKESTLFLNYSRRSVYEVSNMLIVLNRKTILTKQKTDDLLDKLISISKMITSFKKSLNK